MRRRRRVLLSTVSSDAHTWNLVFLQLLLEEYGYAVTNLGPCVPDEVLLRAVRDEQPDAIVISSINGHGHLDGARLARALRRDERIRHVPMIIGGKLGIRGNDNDGYVDQLLAAGFDAVFTDSSDMAGLTRLLAALPARTTHAPATYARVGNALPAGSRVQ
jgi:methylaspartate mutase sigma subunit